MPHYILSIDQGTTGTTVVIIAPNLELKSKVTIEYPQIYPQPGWVEHHPNAIWKSTLDAIQKSLEVTNIQGNQIAAIGITNQRETTVLWSKKDHTPVYNAIVWQCRRTTKICDILKKKGLEKKIKLKTGLVLDPYFSGTKVKWILENVELARKLSKDKNLKFGTVDTFLVDRLTKGDVHVTDPSNASRTLMMNLKTLQWDDELLEILNIPKHILPMISSSSTLYGKTKGVPGLPDGVPISGIAGDQQAALFGQACFDSGSAKCTYGTGAFLLMNTGSKIVYSKNGLLTTVAWKINDHVTYALEGSAFIAGAAVQWLRDGLKIISSSTEVEQLAMSVKDTNGVIFVPALTGLGAPYWNPNARGIILGLTRGVTNAHIARATLEGIAFQNYEILKAMEEDFGKKLKWLRVDGGASANNLLMQFQTDILGVKLVRPKIVETTALGAAFLAGLGVGVWKDILEIKNSWREDRLFNPNMRTTIVKKKVLAWKVAVKKA